MRHSLLILMAVLGLSVAAGAADKAKALTPADYAEIQQLYARYNYAMDSSDRKQISKNLGPILRQRRLDRRGPDGVIQPTVAVRLCRA